MLESTISEFWNVSQKEKKKINSLKFRFIYNLIKIEPCRAKSFKKVKERKDKTFIDRILTVWKNQWY